jgi:TolB protein
MTPLRFLNETSNASTAVLFSKPMQKPLTLLLLLSLSGSLLAQKPVGIFENHGDVGGVLKAGAATYDPSSRVYTLSGAGENIWFKKDEMHMAWRKLRGDFIATTQASLVGKGVDPHRKTGWMVRTSLDTSAAMVTLTVHGDGLTAFQYRKKNGTNIEEIKTPILHPDVLQLERRGRSYFVSIAKLGEPFWTVEIPDFDFPEDLMVGLFVCSHNKNVIETATHTQTRIYTALR